MIFNLIQPLNTSITTEYNPFVLYLLPLLAVTFAIFVIVSKNPIVSVLFLIALFSIIAIFLITIGLNFIGISYILVYVGAVSILFLFILMLINIRVSELSSYSENSLLLLLIIGLFFITTISSIIPHYDNNNTVPYVNYNTWDSKLSGTTNILSLGNVMYSNYSVWLILASIILLLAMVGAIVITIKPNNLYSNINTSKGYNLLKMEASRILLFIHIKFISHAHASNHNQLQEESEQEWSISDWSENYPEIYEIYIKNKSNEILTWNDIFNSKILPNLDFFEMKGILNLYPNLSHLNFNYNMDILSYILNNCPISYTAFVVLGANIVVGGCLHWYITEISSTKYKWSNNLDENYLDAISRNARSEHLTVMMEQNNIASNGYHIDYESDYPGGHPESGEELRDLLRDQDYLGDFSTDLLTNWLSRNDVINFINSEDIDVNLYTEPWIFYRDTMEAYRLDIVDYDNHVEAYHNLRETVNNHSEDYIYITREQLDLINVLTSVNRQSGIENIVHNTGIQETPYRIRTSHLQQFMSTTNIENSSYSIKVKFMKAKVDLYDIISRY